MRDLAALPVTTITPNARVRHPFQALRVGLRDLHESRFLLWQLFRKEMLSQFRQRLLGYAWVLLGPLLGIASFLFMKATDIIRPGDTEMPYALYALVGATVWGALIACVSTMGASLLTQSDLVLRASASKLVVTLASASSVVFSQVMSVFVFALAGWSLGFPASPWIALYPLLVVPMLLLGASLGVVLAALNVLARDFTNLAIAVLGFAMYLCPVVYVPRFSDERLMWIVSHNPAHALIEFPRRVIFFGDFSHFGAYLASFGFVLVAAVFALHVFYRVEGRIAERL